MPYIKYLWGGQLQPKVIEETRCVGVLSMSKWGTQYHQQDRVYKGDIALAQPANLPEGSYKYIVASRGRNPQNPNDRTTGSPTEQRLEVNMNGTTNTLTTVQKDNLVLEQDCREIKNQFYEQATQYRIRKLTPRECWRLMGYTDEDFEKAAFEKKELYIQGDNEKCNAKLKTVQEKPKHTDTESFVLCTTSDIKSMEILKIIKKSLAETPENEKTQDVNFVITKSENLERSECATNTTKCITFMGMRCFLTEGKDQLVMVITEQGKEGKQNTEKFMKIITELNSNPLKLYTILILTAQIIESKIYGSTTLQANIKGNTQIIDVCESSILLKISNLKMESTSVRVSSSQLYKQAGNAIVKQVLMAIFSQML
jgi:hypothetical protein